MTTVKSKPTDKKNLDTTSFISKLQTAIDISESVQEENKDKISQYYYNIGTFNILLEQEMKVEYLTELKVSKVPYVASWYEGITSVRGIVMPVIDIYGYLETQLDLGEKRKETSSSFIKINNKLTSVIFRIENLPQLENIKEYKEEKAPKDAPSWQEKKLGNGKIDLLQINHSQLINQIINTKS